MRFAFLVVGLTIPLALLLVGIRRDYETLKTSAATLLFAAVWFCFMWAAPRLSARRQFRGTPSAQSPISIEASDAGLVVHSAFAESKLSWSTYVAWTEAKSVFVILPQPRIYVPIPKRAFTAEEQSQFREILRRNIVAK